MIQKAGFFGLQLSQVDLNFGDSNVGGRKDRNIRDNLFIVNGVINFAKQNNLEDYEPSAEDEEK